MHNARFSVAVAVAATFAFALAVAAHDLFIKLDSYHVPANASVTVPILNNTFLESANSITADRVADASWSVRGDRGGISMEGWDAGGDTTFVDWRTGEAGTYVIGVSTRPRDLGMSAEDFNLYLASDGVEDVLRQRALDLELDLDAWERYSKHVKAIVQVGDAHSGELDVVFGYPAELVPLQNPYESSVGEELAFRVLVDGEPVQGQQVIAGGVRGSEVIPEREARSDGNGIVRFTVDAPGRWYLKFINMQKTDEPDLDYESKWATLTFEIR